MQFLSIRGHGGPRDVHLDHGWRHRVGCHLWNTVLVDMQLVACFTALGAHQNGLVLADQQGLSPLFLFLSLSQYLLFSALYFLADLNHIQPVSSDVIGISGSGWL